MSKNDVDREFHDRIAAEMANGKYVPSRIRASAYEALKRSEARTISEQVLAAVDAGASPMDAWER